jgi:outer membrane protein assembly factor BamB
MWPVILPMLQAPSSSADWPCWKGPNRDGKALDTGILREWPAGGPKLLWKNSEIGKGFSTVSISKDMLYITGDFEKDLMICALDSKGQMKWKVPHGPAWTGDRPGSRSTPAIDGTKLYVIGGRGLVGCYDIAEGKQVWQRDTKEFGGGIPQWGYTESLLILDNMLIVTPGGKNAIVALDKTTGKEIWLSDSQAVANYSSPIVIGEKGGMAIVQGTGSGLIIVDAKDGKLLWSDPFSAKNTANAPDPAYADGYIFWANGYNKGGICVKADFKDGKWSFTEAWKTKDMVCHHGGYIIDKGYIYGNHNSGWSCIELKSGQTRWKDQKGVGKGSIFFADGMLFLFGEQGGLVGLAPASPEGLNMCGTFNVPGSGTAWSHPVVNDGKLYVRYDVNLCCYDLKNK